MQLFERPRKGERAVLVAYLPPSIDVEETLIEFRDLAVSAGADVLHMIPAKRREPDATFLIGRGKLQEIKEIVQRDCADVVIFSHPLAPAQERNLERELQCRVIDRTGLILDIFAQRARSFEGKLQVELAQLRHLSTRLIRGWTHLERQKGGIGLRGPGETQLETDRRLIGERIKQLKKRLEKVSRHRHEQRKRRVRSTLMAVSVVGYTNAGKSTLFNKLTGAQVYAADQLFATLDPTLRRVELPGAAPVILADTVGFIRDLPHSLVAAFRATLEETIEADLLLHVIDGHDENHQERIDQVNAVLAEIGADQVPQLIVINKIDLIPGREPRLEHNIDQLPSRVWVSAVTGAGMDLLLVALGELSRAYSQTLERTDGERTTPLLSGRENFVVHLAPKAGRLHALLCQHKVVSSEAAAEDGGWLLTLKQLPPSLVELLEHAIELGEAALSD